jgi:hypothetical protein
MVAVGGITLAPAVAPQVALATYNVPASQPPIAFTTIKSLFSSDTPTPPAATTPSAGATSPGAANRPSPLPVVNGVFQNDKRPCGNVPTSVQWMLTNTATSEGGQPANEAISYLTFVGDARFSVAPVSGTLAPGQSVTLHVTGPAVVAHGYLTLNYDTSDANGQYTDYTDTITCATTP